MSAPRFALFVSVVAFAACGSNSDDGLSGGDQPFFSGNGGALAAGAIAFAGAPGTFGGAAVGGFPSTAGSPSTTAGSPPNAGAGGSVTSHPAGSGGTTTSGGSAPAGCAHDVCTQGGPLAITCSPCTLTVCGSADTAYCCKTGWDEDCTAISNIVCDDPGCTTSAGGSTSGDDGGGNASGDDGGGNASGDDGGGNVSGDDVSGDDEGNAGHAGNASGGAGGHVETVAEQNAVAICETYNSPTNTAAPTQPCDDCLTANCPDPVPDVCSANLHDYCTTGDTPFFCTCINVLDPSDPNTCHTAACCNEHVNALACYKAKCGTQCGLTTTQP